ncbi:MAG TPA: VPLPA-CTERM sorting domain-containing protein [Cellvibrionaceae bacterium]|nr:VPLPA-CTERM sorting domain-containing protein [Cellvibrionaceae bacterium]HMW71518.1 VPLPA-CTERM sorting domain-containing protein [Cellvibrionaceae bacterium]HMY37775.1 VPLPA-CTERM sorting domain-containing protein [Marinagarivorans sp.]HNG59102.1 VPLPA-CTERM sorting domain-containing protein [Cellvibrionaceae bacterium]
MKIKALLAAALVATSSASFASVDDGIDPATLTGGELILAAWDDVAKKSILFDTGVTFKQILDAPAPFSVNLNTIDATYKSFFNNNFTNVYWNAYVGSWYGDAVGYQDAKYFGAAYTSKDPDFEIANPLGYNDVVALITGPGEAVSRFNENFVSPKDTTATSVNRSYKANDATAPNYVGNLTQLWGDTQGQSNGRGTSAKAGEAIAFVYNGTADFDTGFVKKLGTLKFDPTTDSLRINTPLPAAAWLLMSGIAGFGAIARRRKQQA